MVDKKQAAEAIRKFKLQKRGIKPLQGTQTAEPVQVAQLVVLESTKKYQIIYADPPWKYWAGGHKNAARHYPCMEMVDIEMLPVGQLAAKDCILFLWVTFPILNEVFGLITKWGFTYSTVGFVWVKSKKDGTGFAFGCGNWTRANAELCLIAIKGKIGRNNRAISQIVYEPRRKHSQKPDCIRKKIIQLVGDLPRIELFAREKTDGWDVWGNEVESDIEIARRRIEGVKK